MLSEALVSVAIDGVTVEGSCPARLRAGVVVAPLDPYVRDIAELVEANAGGERFIFERGGQRIEVALGSALARSSGAVEALPIAPFLRGNAPIIPLAAVARALGARVDYDARAHALHIELPRAPLATMTPYAGWTPPPGPLATFTPRALATPQPSLTGRPQPRRTPIVVE